MNVAHSRRAANRGSGSVTRGVGGFVGEMTAARRPKEEEIVPRTPTTVRGSSAAPQRKWQANGTSKASLCSVSV